MTSTGESTTGVTPGGLCECLQGSTAMARGVVVFSGPRDIVQEHVRNSLPAVFRRVHCEAHLSWMLTEDIAKFFYHFLLRFLPDCPEEEWKKWQNVFLDKHGPWAEPESITLDMVKQFLMQHITDASCKHLGTFRPSGQGHVNEFRAHRNKYKEFFQLVCDSASAKTFLQAYSPVHQTRELPAVNHSTQPAL